MYTLAPDEKMTTVMIYTHNSLVRGGLVTKESMRVNIWLRMQGQVHYVNIHTPQILNFAGSLTKSLSYDELYLPISQIIGFHPAQPGDEPLDYDASEPNRTMKEVQISLQNFSATGKVRVSMHTDFATSIEVAHAGWLSVYDVEIVAHFVPEFPKFYPPMMLVNPMAINFGV